MRLVPMQVTMERDRRKGQAPMVVVVVMTMANMALTLLRLALESDGSVCIDADETGIGG